MCHAPIVIPEIAGPRGEDCLATTRAMREAAAVLVAAGPASVVLLSPHAPRHAHAFGWYGGTRLRGDFRAFGVHGLERSFTSDTAAGEELCKASREAGLLLEPIGEQPLDHGALVPLWFLAEAGYKGELVVLGFPWHATAESKQLLGKLLRETMARLGRPWALLASGDMSHRLLRGAPAGYHARAHAFDEALVALVKEGRYGETGSIDPELRELAAEDVVESLDIAAAVLDGATRNARYLSYEGPFGVGYLEAILHAEG